jgi:Na+/H+-dicarboxylate symporter
MTMTLLASVGTAGIPSGAFILLIVLLDTVGLDPYWVAIIMPVDRLLDMMLTVVNITGDMAVATVVQQGEENNK